ncbi:MAG: hypothetical protein JRH14_10350 [Deltaproteobacteria bacterium]|nr:hypothetical protein [Deltaproteobacteria bacterium]
MEIIHHRAFGASSARAAIVDMVLQLRGEEEAEHVLDALRAHGFNARLVD